MQSTIDPFNQTELFGRGQQRTDDGAHLRAVPADLPRRRAWLGLRYDGEGNYAMVTTTAFVNEPSR
jgi:hypothetical protein